MPKINILATHVTIRNSVFVVQAMEVLKLYFQNIKTQSFKESSLPDILATTCTVSITLSRLLLCTVVGLLLSNIHTYSLTRWHFERIGACSATRQRKPLVSCVKE